jgi:5'-nucleotidase
MHLVNSIKSFAEVVVVAPDKHQSGKGHAITLGSPLRVTPNKRFGDDVLAYECNGTPADCVKVGKHLILKDRAIDLVVSGVNHGSNASIAVVYSGTMSAALEAAIEHLPAIGFSLCDLSYQADFSHTSDLIAQICNNVLVNKIPKGVALNVNFPHKSDEPIKGIKICRQSASYYKELFEERKDPYNRPYYWLDGSFVRSDMAEGTDEWALENNYASIVPCKFDLTDYASLSSIKTNFE